MDSPFEGGLRSADGFPLRRGIKGDVDMDIQDVEFAKTSGDMIAKLSRIVLDQATELAKLRKENSEHLGRLIKAANSTESDVGCVKPTDTDGPYPS
jgi:hypothetical protein